MNGRDEDDATAAAPGYAAAGTDRGDGMDGNPVAAPMRGDIDGVRAAGTPDARVRHRFDGVADQRPTPIATSRARFVVGPRCRPAAHGRVRQHPFAMRPHGGARPAWPVRVVVHIENGPIARPDEHIARSAPFTPGDGPLATPGPEEPPTP